jgi:hypothetical protein
MPGVVLPTYYMSKDAQVRQLAANGFFDALVIDQRGNPVAAETINKGLFLHYIARKGQ